MIQLFHHHFSPWKSTESSRTIAPESAWRRPLRWNRAAEKAGERIRVRVGCDLFEGWEGAMVDAESRELWVHDCEPYPEPNRYCPMPTQGISAMLPHEVENLENGMYRRVTLDDVRRRVFALIDATPWVDWIVATEWPGNVAGMLPHYRCSCSGGGTYSVIVPKKSTPPLSRCDKCGDTGPFFADRHSPTNLFLGVHVTTQAEADERIPLLLKTPAAVRWVECVPREEICVARWFGPQTEGQWLNVVECGHDRLKYGIGWLYVTGERGPDARPLQSIIEQCRSAGVPVWADGTDFNELPQLQK